MVSLLMPDGEREDSVFANIRFILKFERGHLERGRFVRLGWERTAILAIFRPVNRRISETVQDRTKVAIDHQ